MELHRLDSHPDKSAIPVKEWKEFLVEDEKEFLKHAMERRLRKQIVDAIVERIRQNPDALFAEYFDKTKMAAVVESAIESEDSLEFGGGAMFDMKEAAEEIVSERMGEQTYDESSRARRQAERYWKTPIDDVTRSSISR
jgi:hypothetical protein